MPEPLWRRLTRALIAAPERKSGGQALAALIQTGAPVWTRRDFGALVDEGFRRNPVAYRCVRMIAEAAAAVPAALYDGTAELDAHPLLDLVARPDGRRSWTDFFEAFHAQLQVAGDAYLSAAFVDGVPRALHMLRPDRVRPELGPDGWPESWVYEAAGRIQHIAPDPVSGIAGVLQVSLIDPGADHSGHSPIAAAASAIDVHNAGSAWAKALLDNAARPSGAIVYLGADGARHLTDEQFERLRAELEESHQGARNAGRPLVLDGGLDWKPMSHSPAEMDFIEARHAAAREIALAFGVPPMLLGIPGDNTYANYREANLVFWRQTAVPLAARTMDALAGWLGPAFGPGLRLAPDLDAIPALAPEREAAFARIAAADFLSVNEKRASLGWGAVAGGDAPPPAVSGAAR